MADAIFRHLSNSIALHSGAALVPFPLFLILAYIGVQHLVKHDKQLPQRFRLKDYLRAARQGRVLEAGYMLKTGLCYLSPGHSPRHEGSTAQALAYLADMPEFSANPHH